MDTHHVRFSNANLNVKVHAVATQLSGDRWLLECGIKGAKDLNMALEEGVWKWKWGNEDTTDTAPAVITSDKQGTARLITRMKGESHEVIEGSLQAWSRTDSIAGFEFSDKEMWITAEGFVRHVDADDAIPFDGKGGEVLIPALFVWQDGQWQWRLLPRWPRKGGGDKAEAAFPLHSRLGKVWSDWRKGFLPFLSKLAQQWDSGLDHQGVGSDLLIQDEENPIGEGDSFAAQLTPFSGNTNDLSWSLPLRGGRLVLNRRFDPAKLHLERRGVLDDYPESESLVLRPNLLTCQITERHTIYTFLENKTGDATGEKDWDLQLEIAPEKQDLELEPVVAMQLKKNGALPLLPLAPAPSADGPAAAVLWLRAVDGFARLAASDDEGTKGMPWAESAILSETRDMRVSLWLDDAKHQDAACLDLSLLLDNCGAKSLVITCDRNEDGTWSSVKAALRIWQPAVRLTLPRHAAALGSELPPFERPGANDPVFHPLVFLSPSVAKQDGGACFCASLKSSKQGFALGFVENVGTRATLWRQLAGHAAVGETEWSANDPSAASAPSPLRGWFPVMCEPSQIKLKGMPGGVLEVNKTKTLNEVAELARNRRFLLLNATEAGGHPELEFTKAGITARLRHAWPHFDAVYARSLPQVPGDGRSSVPESFTHVRNRWFDPEGKKINVATLLGENLAKGAGFDSVAPAPHLRIAAREQTHIKVGQADAPLFLLIVRGPLKTPLQWTVIAGDGTAKRPTQWGIEWEPGVLSMDTADRGKVVIVAKRRFTPSLPSPIPGHQAGDCVLRIQFGQGAPSIEGRIALAAADVSGKLQATHQHAPGHQWLGVISEKVSLLENGNLWLQNLEFWFESDGEVFIVETSQSMKLTTDGALVDLDGTDAPALMRVPPAAEGENAVLTFQIEQHLPGLRLEQTLIDTKDSARQGQMRLYLEARNIEASVGEADLLPLGSRTSAAGVTTIALALKDLGTYGDSKATISGKLGFRLKTLNRVYLRLRRRQRLITSDALSPFEVLEAMIGWTADSAFQLEAAKDGLHATLRSTGGDEKWSLEFNGELLWNDLKSAAGPGQVTMSIRTCVWDAMFNVNWDAERQMLDLAHDEPAQNSPALSAFKCDKPGDGGWDCEWTALHNLDIDADGAQLDIVMSVEQTKKRGGSRGGFLYLRPNTKLALWDFPRDEDLVDEKGVIVRLRLRSDEEAPQIKLPTHKSVQDNASQWRSFYLGADAAWASVIGEPGTLPDSQFRSVPRFNGEDSLAFLHSKEGFHRDAEAVGHTLYQSRDGDQVFWLRSCARAIEAGGSPIMAHPCVWIWKPEHKRLVRLWIHPEKRPFPDLKEADLVSKLQKLAEQVLAQSGWHKAAILEYRSDADVPTWKLIDSPVLDRSLSLESVLSARSGLIPQSFQTRQSSVGLATALPQNMRVSEGSKPAKTASIRSAEDGSASALVETAFEATTVLSPDQRSFASVEREIPFELDGDTLMPTPAQGWFPNPPAHQENQFPIRDDTVRWRVTSPRPGEIAGWIVGTTTMKDDEVSLGGARELEIRTPLAASPNEPRAELRAIKIPVPNSSMGFHDHLDGLELSWRTRLPDLLQPTAEAPLQIALHSPAKEKRIVLGQPMRIRTLSSHSGVRAKLNPSAHWRIYLVFANDTPQPPDCDFVVTHFSGDDQTPTHSHHQGKSIGLLIGTSKSPEEPDLRTSVWELAFASPLAIGKWKTRWHVIKSDNDLPDTPVLLLEPAKVVEPGFQAPAFEFIVKKESTGLAATPVTGFVSVLADHTRVVAFGPDAPEWLPVYDADLQALVWERAGKLVDVLPKGTELPPAYSLVTLHSDGARTERDFPRQP